MRSTVLAQPLTSQVAQKLTESTPRLEQQSGRADTVSWKNLRAITYTHALM